MTDKPIMLMRRSMLSLRPVSRASEDALQAIEEGYQGDHKYEVCR